MESIYNKKALKLHLQGSSLLVHQDSKLYSCIDCISVFYEILILMMSPRMSPCKIQSLIFCLLKALRFCVTKLVKHFYLQTRTDKICTLISDLLCNLFFILAFYIKYLSLNYISIKLKSKMKLFIPFRTIMSFAKHLTITNRSRATFTPSGHMVSIHF